MLYVLWLWLLLGGSCLCSEGCCICDRQKIVLWHRQQTEIVVDSNSSRLLTSKRILVNKHYHSSLIVQRLSQQLILMLICTMVLLALPHVADVALVGGCRSLGQIFRSALRYLCQAD